MYLFELLDVAKYCKIRLFVIDETDHYKEHITTRDKKDGIYGNSLFKRLERDLLDEKVKYIIPMQYSELSVYLDN